MLRKDLLVRQLEEFGKVMAIILGTKKQNDWESFEREIHDASIKFTHLEINTVENLDGIDFEKQILNSPTLIQDQKKILADLLFEKLNFYAEKNEGEKYIDRKAKCLKLYQHIQDNHTDNEFDMNVYYKLAILKQ
ncbi:MAG: hypothetical protein WCH21_10825 [Bacteroidota bacterium]